MVVQTPVRPNNGLQEMRRLAKTKKLEKDDEKHDGKKKPFLGAGRHSQKGNKEVPGEKYN